MKPIDRLVDTLSLIATRLKGIESELSNFNREYRDVNIFGINWRQAAHLLNVHPKTVLRHCKKNEIDPVIIERRAFNILKYSIGATEPRPHLERINKRRKGKAKWSKKT